MAVDTWIIVAGEPGVKNLVDVARGLGGRVRALVVGEKNTAETIAASGVDEVAWIRQDDGVPAEAYAPAVQSAVRGKPGILIGGRHPEERVLFGAAAAALKAPVLTGVSSVTTDGCTIVVKHAAFGGITERTVGVDGPVALVLDGGGTPEAGPVVDIEEQPVETLQGVRLVGRTDSTDEHADLASAQRVIGIGRGLKKQEDLEIIEQLAQALNAEIGCTRPLAEGLEWLSRDRYIGISGQHISPKLYLAVGVSGQLQHIDGVRGAELIVSINSDSNAPISAQSDYSLVADLYDLVPALTSALSGK